MIGMVMGLFLLVTVGGYSVGAFDEKSVDLDKQMKYEATLQAFDEGEDNA